MELLGAFDGVLAEHRVGYEQDLVRLHAIFDFLKLVHQRFIDVKTAGGIDNHHVVGCVSRLADCVLAKF